MSMYDYVVVGEPNIQINGVDFYMESFKADEPVQRREVKRTSLMNGTEYVSRGKWVGRSFSFTTTICVPADKPDAYDSIIDEIVNGVVEVYSMDLGRMDAEVTVSKTHDKYSPDKLELSFNVKEVADKSSIKDDEVLTPPTEIVKEKEEEKNDNKSSS